MDLIHSSRETKPRYLLVVGGIMCRKQKFSKDRIKGDALHNATSVLYRYSNQVFKQNEYEDTGEELIAFGV